MSINSILALQKALRRASETVDPRRFLFGNRIVSTHTWAEYAEYIPDCRIEVSLVPYEERPDTYHSIMVEGVRWDSLKVRFDRLTILFGLIPYRDDPLGVQMLCGQIVRMTAWFNAKDPIQAVIIDPVGWEPAEDVCDIIFTLDQFLPANIKIGVVSLEEMRNQASQSMTGDAR